MNCNNTIDVWHTCNECPSRNMEECDFQTQIGEMCVVVTRSGEICLKRAYKVPDQWYFDGENGMDFPLEQCQCWAYASDLLPTGARVNVFPDEEDM